MSVSGEHLHAQQVQAPTIPQVVAPVAQPVDELLREVLDHKGQITTLQQSIEAIDKRLYDEIDRVRTELTTLLNGHEASHQDNRNAIEELTRRFDALLALGTREVEGVAAVPAEVVEGATPAVSVQTPEPEKQYRTIRRFGGRKLRREVKP